MPITRYRSLSSVSMEPTSDGSLPKRLRQSVSFTSTDFVPFHAVSSGAKMVVPLSAFTPRMRKKSPPTTALGSCSGSPEPVSTAARVSITAMEVNE
jgi:hypothetical protein